MRFIDCKSVYVGGPISLNGTATPEQIEENLQKFFIMVAQAAGKPVFAEDYGPLGFEVDVVVREVAPLA